MNQILVLRNQLNQYIAHLMELVKLHVYLFQINNANGLTLVLILLYLTKNNVKITKT